MPQRKNVRSDAPARVLIVDDHPAVREALQLWVSRHADLQACGEAATGQEALQLIETTRPDIAVVDLHIKHESGLELIKRIRSRHPNLPILVWSMLNESAYAERVLRAGAQGYVNKEQAAEQIITAIYRVLDGKCYLSEPTAERLLRRTIQGRGRSDIAEKPLVDQLSDRELEAFEWIGRGLDTQEVAKRMHVSAKTVETYRARIKEKLGIDRHGELVRQAVEWVLQGG